MGQRNSENDEMCCAWSAHHGRCFSQKGKAVSEAPAPWDAMGYHGMPWGKVATLHRSCVRQSPRVGKGAADMGDQGMASRNMFRMSQMESPRMDAENVSSELVVSTCFNRGCHHSWPWHNDTFGEDPSGTGSPCHKRRASTRQTSNVGSWSFRCWRLGMPRDAWGCLGFLVLILSLPTEDEWPRVPLPGSPSSVRAKAGAVGDQLKYKDNSDYSIMFTYVWKTYRKIMLISMTYEQPNKTINIVYCHDDSVS